MIALIRLRPPPGWASTYVLHRLPPLPAGSASAFVVHCQTRDEVREVLEWYGQLKHHRPEVPMGLVADPVDCARDLASYAHALAFLLHPQDLQAGKVPAAKLDRLREASVAGALVREITSEHGRLREEEEAVIRSLVCRGMHGGTVESAARDLGISPETIRRRLGRLGISPGALVRRIRHRAFELRIGLGADRHASLLAAGWSSHEQRRKAHARIHRS